MSQNKEKLKIKILLPRFYTYLVLIFFLFTLVFGASFIYYVFGIVKITITPNYEKLSLETDINIRENLEAMAPDSKNIPGKLFVFEVSDRIEIPATGKKAVRKEGIGKVVLFNKSEKNQPLIATTRLLAPDGTLLRLKERVVIPAGSSMEAGVYPDKPEQFTELLPTKFIIPGLPENLQDIIYAENKTPLGSGEKIVTYVSKDDIQNVDAKIKQEMESVISKKSEDLVKDSQTYYSGLVHKEVIDKKFDAKYGDEVGSFGVDAKILVVVVQFNERQVIEQVKKEISRTLPQGKMLKDLDPKSIEYPSDSSNFKYDLESSTVHMKLFVEGRAQVKQDNKIFDKKVIFGKSREEIQKYFSGFEEIENVKVEFFPSWIPRAPRSEEKIEIIIE